MYVCYFMHNKYLYIHRYVCMELYVYIYIYMYANKRIYAYHPQLTWTLQNRGWKTISLETRVLCVFWEDGIATCRVDCLPKRFRDGPGLHWHLLVLRTQISGLGHQIRREPLVRFYASLPCADFNVN